jgi:hypothetical protein
MRHQLHVARAYVQGGDPARVADELRERLAVPDLQGVLFFASSRTDFAALATALDGRFACPTIGCTTAGEITSETGHVEGGVAAVALGSPALRIHGSLLPAEDASLRETARIAEELLASRTLGLPDRQSFAIALMDGLGMQEERLVAGLHTTLRTIPLVGGSAGDDLAFTRTHVACNGRTQSHGAVAALVETAHPFELFHANHFQPTDRRLVITAADPSTRCVQEIDGEPAIDGYARAFGLSRDEVTSTNFTSHPVMLRVGDGYYARSIRCINEDGSLSFYCAIDVGLTLRIAEWGDIVGGMRAEMQRIRQRIPDLALTLGFDCILRKRELLGKNLVAQAHDAIRDAEMIGFSTYGEQFHSVHINQTLTGVALGRSA